MPHPNVNQRTVDIESGQEINEHTEPTRYVRRTETTPIGLSGLMERSVSGSKPFTSQELKKGFRKLLGSKLKFGRKR